MFVHNMEERLWYILLIDALNLCRFAYFSTCAFLFVVTSLYMEYEKVDKCNLCKSSTFCTLRCLCIFPWFKLTFILVPVKGKLYILIYWFSTHAHTHTVTYACTHTHTHTNAFTQTWEDLFTSNKTVIHYKMAEADNTKAPTTKDKKY